MKTSHSFDIYAAGLAIFSMFFGAGNIIFPLALGYHSLSQTPYAIAGLLLTAILIPFSGLFAIFLYQGSTQAFFNRIGKGPGLLLAFLIISLLGPLGSTPRCIALAYSTCKMSIPGLSAVWFSLISCLIIFVLARKKNHLLHILGYWLTPVLVALLGLIVIKGFWEAPALQTIPFASHTNLEQFLYGLQEGYNTMDLLAAFFFAPLVLFSIKQKFNQTGSQASSFHFVLKASLIGAGLLALVYLSFSYLAFYYAPYLAGVPQEELLATISLHILGPYASYIVGIVIILACLTTAIALISSFSTFVYQDLLAKRVEEKIILIGSLILTFAIATFEFQGISQFLGPILQMCYPALIILTLFNIAYKFYSLKRLKLREIAAMSCETEG